MQRIDDDIYSRIIMSDTFRGLFNVLTYLRSTTFIASRFSFIMFTKTRSTKFLPKIFYLNLGEI